MEGTFGGAFEGKDIGCGEDERRGEGGMMGVGVATDRVAKRGWGVDRLCGGGTGRSCADGLIGG